MAVDPVTRHSETALLVGDWCVRPASGQISRGGETVRLEARAMRLLMCLVERAGDIVSIDELLDRVWSGVNVAPDSVYQAVASLRRILGDDPKQPVYIATVPRLGYQLVAPVRPWDESAATPAPARPESGRRTVVLASLAVALALALVVGTWMAGAVPKDTDASSPTAESQTSIAVLPFLDLTDKMNHELFVDGMTEELVDKLTRIPGIRVPPARSSLAFKGMNAAIRDIAASLGTTYVLDGSVRQSGDALRVAARLVRADTGFVVWSGSYDRSSGDLVTIENDIATEVARSLKASVDGGK